VFFYITDKWFVLRRIWMKLLRTLAVAATLALVACGDENAVALNEPPVSSQEDSSSSSDVIETSSCSETVVTSSSSQTPSTEISNGSIITDGQVIDLRDGRTYKTTVIGNQVWMAENLKLDVTQYVDDGAYKDEYNFYDALWSGVRSREISDTSEHFYPWDIAIDTAGIFGSSAKGCDHETPCDLTGMVRGICPEGFHVPNPTEIEQLTRAIGGKCGTSKKLKAKQSGWIFDNGTDEFGFAAIPTGYNVVHWGDGMNGFTFDYELNPQGKFLTTVDTLTWNIAIDADYAISYREEYEVVDFTEEYHWYMCSLRCLRDEPAGVDWVDPPEPTSPALPEFEYGEFTDERDGQTYKTVVINGKTWMDQNLNYVFDVVDTNAACRLNEENDDDEEYEDECKKSSDYSCKHPLIGSPVSCKNKYSIDDTYCKEHEATCKNYGKFYTWNQALIACPSGWHLPDNNEIEDFMESINPYTVYEGECLLKHTRFKKIEDPDLNKLLYKDFGMDYFQMQFWTSTIANFNDDYANTSGYACHKTDLQNVRCVKD
jgi:uncharacterized protein (TIGR02145 family)